MAPRSRYAFAETRCGGASVKNQEFLIAERAYQLWLGRGCPQGSPDMDWLQAEQEIAARSQGPVGQPDFADTQQAVERLLGTREARSTEPRFAALNETEVHGFESAVRNGR
jgi:hypothetical protein